MNKTRTFLLNKRTFLLIISIFFLWYTIDSLYGYLVTEQKLQSFTGKIESIKVKASTGKRKDSIGLIVLDSYPNHVFETKDLRLVQSGFIQKLKGGDSITICILPRLFQSTKLSSILKIIKDGNVISNNYQIAKNVSRNLFFIFGVLFLLFFLPYILGIKKIITKSKVK